MGESEPPSLDQTFELLSDARRRHALRRLHRDRTMTLPDLADEVAVLEYDEPLQDIDAETVADVYFSLYHCHVPKLVDTGLVEYDQERDTVRLTDGGADVVEWAVAVVDDFA